METTHSDHTAPAELLARNIYKLSLGSTERGRRRTEGWGRRLGEREKEQGQRGSGEMLCGWRKATTSLRKHSGLGLCSLDLYSTYK